MNIFKKCPMCDKVWRGRDSFLRDISLEMNGYQADFNDLNKGLFFFTHMTDGCFSTMAVEAQRFFDLNKNKRYQKRRTSEEDCQGYCFEKNVLTRCEAECECAYVRDVVDIIVKMKKELSSEMS